MSLEKRERGIKLTVFMLFLWEKRNVIFDCLLLHQVETQIQKEKSKKKRKSVLQELSLQLEYISKQTVEIRSRMME